MTQGARYVAWPPTSIGEMEKLAGVADRKEFWKELVPVFEQQGTEAGMDAWRKKVETAIRRRVRAGALTLLYPLVPRRARKQTNQ